MIVPLDNVQPSFSIFRLFCVSCEDALFSNSATARLECAMYPAKYLVAYRDVQHLPKSEPMKPSRSKNCAICVILARFTS